MMPGDAPWGAGEGLAADAGDLPANAKMCARGERRLRCNVEIGDSLGIGCGMRFRGETKHVTVFSRRDLHALNARNTRLQLNMSDAPGKQRAKSLSLSLALSLSMYRIHRWSP
jgi:hypothetical protein